MTDAPASSAFSTSSLTTEAGLSTTSPAAMLLAVCCIEQMDLAHPGFLLVLPAF